MDQPSVEQAFWGSELQRFLPEPRQALREAARHVCCPVCYVVNDVSFRYFAQLPLRWPDEPTVREAVCQSRGFCGAHTWRLSKMQGLRAISQILITILDALPLQTASPQLCPVCRLQTMVESVVLDDFITWLAGEGGRERYRGMFGLCYPHLDRALRRGTSAGVDGLLRDSLEARRTQLLRDLRKFVEKDVPGSRSTRTEAERYAPWRALQALAGNQEM